MKKTFFILFISFIILPLCLYADDDIEIAWADEDEIVEEVEAVEAVDDIEDEAAPRERRVREKKDRGKILGKKRKIEVGFIDVNAGFSNDFLTFGEIFQEKLVLDLDKLSNGFRMNFDLAFSPLYFNYNNDDIWGFGVSTKVETTGILGLSGKMLTFKEAVNEKSDLGGAAFAEVGLHGFFHYKKFKIKVKPALYYPIAYITPDITYTYKNSETNNEAETRLKLGFDLSVYTIGSFENISNGENEFSISATPGIDFYLGAEYPLSEVLGLSDKFFFLNFDVGLDIYNLPMVPSAMNDYLRVSGYVGSDDPVVFDPDMDWDSFYSFEDIVYGEKKLSVMRPFKMITWADWRPFGIKLVSFIPSIGFAINPLYVKPASIEAGLKARLDLLEFFVVTAGTSYEDRMWKNSVDLALDLRAFEFDLGVDLRSSSFAKSWSGGGLGVRIGFKFGW